MKQSFSNTATFEPMRQRRLRAWMCLEGVTWQDIGHVIGLSRGAALMALSKEHLLPERHAILLSTYPTLTADLLPRPEKIPRGPRRKELSPNLA